MPLIVATNSNWYRSEHFRLSACWLTVNSPINIAPSSMCTVRRESFLLASVLNREYSIVVSGEEGQASLCEC
jgi:hypothetical protein